MKLTRQWIWSVAVAVVAAVILSAAGAAAAEPPAAPKVSTFAPVKDVVAQIEFYLTRLDEAVASESDYKDWEARVTKDANTLVLLALAAGLHDEDNDYKAAAPGLIKAAQELSKVAVVKEQAPGTQPSAEEVAKRYAAVKAGVAAVKKAAEAKDGNPGTLKWVKIAELPETMKQVPAINTRLKRNLRGDRFKTRAKGNVGDSAAIAVIAQGSIADTSAVKKPGEEAKWYKYCIDMRDAAGALNKAIHEGKPADGEKAAAALAQSCDDCHDAFHPAAREIMAKEAAKEKE
jgi:hypothetical protein